MRIAQVAPLTEAVPPDFMAERSGCTGRGLVGTNNALSIQIAERSHSALVVKAAPGYSAAGLRRGSGHDPGDAEIARPCRSSSGCT
jgi:hypothetical protein